MDWGAAIGKNREALKRIVAALFVMAGFAGGVIPVALPRHLRNGVLRLLRPAEAAARRLIIVAARGLVVVLPPVRAHSRRRYDPATQPRRDAARGFAVFDALVRRQRPRPVVGCSVPRLSFPGLVAPSLLPLPPSPLDQVGVAALSRRLAVLGEVLGDLPRWARRFACWRARLNEAIRARVGPLARPGRMRRVWPLRPGLPSGARAVHRGAGHEVHAVLACVHGLALWAMAPADTS